MLALTKTSSPRVVRPGQAISYTLQVTNSGEAEALAVRLCDTPPSGVTVTSAPGFHRSGGSICTTIPTLQPSASRTFHLTAKANPGTRGTVVNHATASARNAATVKSNARNVVIKAPSPPTPRPPSRPAPTCPAVSIRGSLEASGHPQTITIIALHNGNPARATLLLSGPGINRVVRLGSRGTATVTLSPRSPGTLTVSPRGIPGCAATTISIASVSPAAVTG
jgi:uncharacterized repeat protein (TIGR01451 family)